MGTRAPTLEDAKAAAEIAAEAGATKVLLFGSVARGEADECSDIDLVAVFDDIDYTKRHQIAHEIKRRIHTKVGAANDVVVTDRPEWKARTQGDVPTCFEAGISVETVTLIDNPPAQSINWGKRMDLPVTRLDEATSRVSDIHRHWNGIDSATGVPTTSEYKAWTQARDYDNYLVERDQRFERMNGEAHLVVEACLKLLLTLYCDTPLRKMRQHSTNKLTELLHDCAPEQAAITEKLRGDMTHDESRYGMKPANTTYVSKTKRVSTIRPVDNTPRISYI